jgi:uncharacterized protein
MQGKGLDRKISHFLNPFYLSDRPMPEIRSAIACNLDIHLLQASLPLLEAEKVQAIEWSFDALYQHPTLPDWFTELLQAFSQEGRLIGHGVFFSLFSGQWTSEQQQWLDQLSGLSREYHFDHITEHFGFMTGADFHKGAPLSIPFTATTLAIGQDRLKRIQQAGQCPVGLENLAFAYSPEEVKRQGDFLHRLVESVNGFIILDLHNLFCQLRNFDVPFEELIAGYPLERVREIHVSGGSWSDSLVDPSRKIRRDTHDDAVPVDVFGLLERAMDRCPNLKYVVLEQISSSLDKEESRQQYRQDFLVMDEIVSRRNQHLAQSAACSFLPAEPYWIAGRPLEDARLHAQQRSLASILETAATYEQAQAALQASSLAHSEWGIEKWEPVMVETAMAIAQKWRNGLVQPDLQQ